MISKETFNITGMSCAVCAARIEKGLSKACGIQSAAVNLATNKATVIYDSSKIKLSEIIKLIENIGYGAQSAIEQSSEMEKHQREKEIKSLRVMLILSALLSSPLILAMVLSLLKIDVPFLHNPEFDS